MVGKLMAPAFALALIVIPAGATGDAAAAAPGLSRPAAVESQEAAIVGTWVLVSPGPSQRLVQTYNADGTMLSIHDEHTTRSTLLGVWSQLGEREFLMRNLSYRFDAAGQLAATIETRGTYTVAADGASMTGQGVRFELDPSGAPLGAPVRWESRATRLVTLPVDAPPGS
jgi:hypothetical protein